MINLLDSDSEDPDGGGSASEGGVEASLGERGAESGSDGTRSDQAGWDEPAWDGEELGGAEEREEGETTDEADGDTESKPASETGASAARLSRILGGAEEACRREFGQEAAEESVSDEEGERRQRQREVMARLAI